MTLSATAKRWPAPRHLLDSMPEKPKRLAAYHEPFIPKERQLENDAAKQRVNAMLKDFAKKLRGQDA